MVSTFTTNKSLEKPATGDQVGTWGGITVNPNMDKIDQSFGGLATIALTNSPVTLSSGQYINAFIRFTGAITANVAITFPAIGSFYTIINDTTNSSNFFITAKTTGGGRTVGLPPGNATPIMTDVTNVRFVGLPPVGTYLDYAGTGLPNWVTACTPDWPYIVCDGGGFSSAVFPQLAATLGGTTTPDFRGRMRAGFNSGTGRITNINGDALFTGGGNQSATIGQANLPNYNLTVNDPGHIHTGHISNNVYQVSGAAVLQTGAAAIAQVAQTALTIDSANTGISVNSAGSGTGLDILPPIAIGGITMIRTGNG